MFFRCRIFFCCLLLFQVANAAEPLFSGPQVGEPLPSFQATGARGEFANKEFDFIKQTDGKPVVLIFFNHQMSRPAFQLVRSLTRQYTTKKTKDGLRTGLIFLTDDPTEKLAWATKVKNYFPEDALIGVSKDGKEGPGAYGLNRDATLTVLVGKESKVTGNFAMGQPSLLHDGPGILNAIAAVLGQEPPSIDDLLAAEKAQMEKMRAGNPRMQNRNAKRRANQQDAKLSGMLRQFINESSDESIKKSAEAIEAYVAKNKRAKTDLAKRATTIVSSGKLSNYGTATVQEFIKTWATKYSKELAEADKQAAESKRTGDAEKAVEKKATVSKNAAPPL